MNKTNLRIVRNPNEDHGLIPIEPLNNGPKQHEAKHSMPERVMRLPTDIWIDPDFQRAISKRGQRLIDNMISEWDWSAFVAPAIYTDPNGIECAYDGQHTLIAAATRDDITTIPCDLHPDIESAMMAAEAFVVRNTARLVPTPLQRYKAALVAKFPWAVKIERICNRLGITIPLYASAGSAKPDTILAIGSLRETLDLRGEQKLSSILKVLTGNGMKPIRDTHIKAVDLLLHSDEYRKLVRADSLNVVLKSVNNAALLHEAVSDAFVSGRTQAQALAAIYYREYQKKYGAA